MSSILEALRELEGDRPPAARRDLPPPEKPPGVTRRAASAFIPIVGGLAVGMLVFGLWAWGPTLTAPPRQPDMAPSAPPAPPPPAAATPERPTWLETADAPRARVDPTPAPERAAPRAAEPAAEPAPRDDPPPASSGGQLVIESVRYAEDAGARTATIRWKGRRMTLRQRESVDGVEVQLIMPNGVYVQRGGEVYLMPVSR